MEVTVSFRPMMLPAASGENAVPYKAPDIVIKDAEDIAVNPLGMIVVLGPAKGEKHQVLGAFPGDAVAGVYAPDGVSYIKTPR